MIDIHYPLFQLMEQFSVREIVPYMIDDFKPSAWLISNRNLASNRQILDTTSINIFSKSTSLLRLIEHISGDEIFQSAVRSIVSVKDLSTVLNTFYSNFDTILNDTISVKEFLESWITKRNYPQVTVELLARNETFRNTTIIFRQNHYSGLFDSNQSSTWIIYMECDVGGFDNNGDWNVTANYIESRFKFIFNSSTHTIELPDEDYLWIKCNKNFYSYLITKYVSEEPDKTAVYRLLLYIFHEVYQNIAV